MKSCSHVIKGHEVWANGRDGRDGRVKQPC